MRFFVVLVGVATMGGAPRLHLSPTTVAETGAPLVAKALSDTGRYQVPRQMRPWGK
jgi:hypothetical protein